MRILAIGEGMVEFSRRGDCWAQAYGGDVLNTAVHLARLGNSVAFASALGEDRFSQFLRKAWLDEGLDLDLVASDSERQCGIYLIATDEVGERNFTYWRDNSAARRMVPLLGDRLVRDAKGSDLIYLSLITLAVLSEADRATLLETVAVGQKTGARFAFDSNYRPGLWENPEEAARWNATASGMADIGLPTLEDEQALGTGETAQEIAHAWSGRGCSEVLVKLGPRGCLLPDGCVAEPPDPVKVVDTSGAGDSFNAAYLSARLRGGPVAEAAALANRLAAWIVTQHGAVPARRADAS